VTILIARIPVTAVGIDQVRYPDRDQSHIFDHLVRYCAKFDPLPAVTVVVEGASATVIRGHKYLQAALALGRPTVRAVIASPPSGGAVRAFLARVDVVLLDWDRIKAEEELERTPIGWHVFFFERSLSSAEKADFDDLVGALFAGVDRDILVAHDDTGPAAEFQARTPVTDEVWARRHLDAFSTFSRDRARIVSYQGRRFEPSGGS
jgi:hypothetical protein